MPENSKVGDASAFRSLTAFKPRQVLLLSSKQRLAMKYDSGKTLSMSKDQKALLLQSIYIYLEKNGFSKTLKKFRSEAEIEKDSWKSCSLVLEEIFVKHLQINHANLDNDTVKGQFGYGDVTVHKVDKKSKDVADDVDVKVEENKREKIDDSVPNHVTPSKTCSEDALSLMSEPTKKTKEKKKKDKMAKKSLNEESESHQKATEIVGGMPMNGSSVKSKSTNDSETREKDKSEEKTKSKSKKKKQESVTPDDLSVGTEEVTKLENKNEKEIETKSSKKRKNNSSEDNKHNHDEGKEHSKRRKTNNSDEQVMKVMTSCANGNIAQGVNVDQQTPFSKTPVNGIMAKKEEEKSSVQQSTKKKQINSAEPKALNAFQRVKADEIEFADERLQDNSYWAKDGADSGYGAKAQEVLGQVRGRGFRHEKTKKKRGSYRGGQIDLQSHSVKFVYEEEDT